MHISEIPDFFILRKKIDLQKKLPFHHGKSYALTHDNGKAPRTIDTRDGKK